MSGGSGGVCVGAPEVKKQVNNKDVDFAQKSLRYLFAKSYGIWEWQNDRYHKLPDYWDDTGVPYGGYNIQAPQINNVKIDNKTTGKIIKGGGGTVEFSFTTDIADEQLPLHTYTIDWGDGKKYILPQGNYQERPNPNDPHLYYHTYAYDLMNCGDPTARCQDTQCLDPDTGEKHKCKILNITVEVTDNWYKTSTAQSAQITVWE